LQKTLRKAATDVLAGASSLIELFADKFVKPAAAFPGNQAVRRPAVRPFDVATGSRPCGRLPQEFQ
jgi:hypothetical protein